MKKGRRSSVPSRFPSGYTMTRSMVVFWLVTWMAMPVFSADLGTNEVNALLLRAAKVKDALDRGDADVIIQLTHPSIYRLTNGKEGFEEMTRKAVEQVRTLDMNLLESSLGRPSRTYGSGTDTVCFIPRTSVWAVNGKKVKSIGFLVAVKGPGASDWLFLDGSGLRENPELLKTLLPGLPSDVALPENRKELVDSE